MKPKADGTPDHGLEAAKGQPRSAHWPAVEKSFLQKHPKCYCCGTTIGVQVHHKFPFHFCVGLGRPDLELDDRNLMTLCETEQGHHGENHHLLIGHLDSWESFDKVKDVVDDAQVSFKNMKAAKIKTNAKWKQKEKLRYKSLSKMNDEEKAEVRTLLDTTYPKLH